MKLILCLFVTTASLAIEAARLPDARDDNSIRDDKPSFHPFDRVGVAAAPIIRADNTTKSRIVDDTLLREGPSQHEVGFDSLTNHQRENALLPPARSRPAVTSTDLLGNLHPEEVFYADDDLLIIKGGGFQGPLYTEPQSGGSTQNDEDEFNYNELTAVRRPPNPHEEYNGNVPTIVRPPVNHAKFSRRQRPHRPSAPPTYYQSPLALFLPARILAAHESDSDESGAHHYYYVPAVQYNAPPPPVIPSYLWWLLQHAFPHYQPSAALSLAGDTDVNFVDPMPPVNPDAELIAVSAAAESERYEPSHRHRTRPRL